jgi:hypothetical protein
MICMTKNPKFTIQNPREIMEKIGEKCAFLYARKIHSSMAKSTSFTFSRKNSILTL